MSIPGCMGFLEVIGRGSKLNAWTEGGARAYVGMVIGLFSAVRGSPRWRGRAGRRREEISLARLVRPRSKTMKV